MTTADGRGAEATGPRSTGVAAVLAGRGLRAIGAALLSLCVICAAWLGFIRLFSVNPLVARTPLDVWTYLVSASHAAQNRKALLGDLGVTLGHAGLGFVAGLGLGAGTAMLFVLSRTVERTVMPLAMVLRSVPLIAMMPMVVLVFGRGLATVAVIGTVVVFFPTLVNVALGLRSAPRLAGDLVQVYGGGPATVLRKVRVPSALPALFASARIAVPGSLVGSLLAEWLATGDGLGYRMQRDISTFKSTDLWSGVALLTVVSLTGYVLVGVIEAAILSRYAFQSARD